MVTTVMIRVTPEIRKALRKQRVVPRESYNDVIKRLIIIREAK